MKIHNFFPLSIFQDQIQISIDEKNNLINEIRKMKDLSKNSDYKLKNASWTGDTQGFEYLHKNKLFNKLFDEIKKKIILYLNFLKVDQEQIDIFMQRSWATISNNKEVIRKHQHLQSHVSFAYYLKKNTNDGSLNFHNEALHNEIAPGLFYSSSSKSPSKDFFKRNFFNARIVNIHPKVDEIYIFPSKSIHSTSPNKTNEERISISADISLITKESENIENLITPIDKWMKF